MYRYAIHKVDRVVDGDTIDVIIDLGFSVWTKQRIRLNRLDAPEMNSRDEVERGFAAEAKAFISKWIAGNPRLVIDTSKDDKYGRMLGDIYPVGSTASLNEEMIARGYAWEYDGGKREKNFKLLMEKRGQ